MKERTPGTPSARLALRSLATVAVAWLMAASGPAAGGRPVSVTVPFVMDHARVFIDLDFVRPDGSFRRARAWVDTGNDALILGEALARDLGFEISKGPAGDALPLPKAPGILLDGWPLETSNVSASVLPGPRLLPGLPAEAQLPACLFMRYHIILDYPGRRLTVAKPGGIRPRGVPVPCRVNDTTGLFLVEGTADGEKGAFGVDTGSSYSWVSISLVDAVRARHPDRPSAVGAAGEANFFGFGFEAKGVLGRLQELVVGDLRIPGPGVLGLPQGLFDWYSKKSAGPVRGFIGGAVLKHFRLEVDFPGRMTYWEAGPAADPFDLDIVGLTLRPEADGGYAVAGVVVKDGVPTVEGVLPGDRLLRVDGLEASGTSMGRVVDALRGAPGSRHTLVLERAGRRFVIEARTARLA